MLDNLLKECISKIDKKLFLLFERKSSKAPELWKVMQYAVLGNGKRIRPLLVLASAALNGKGLYQSGAMDCALAIELFHTYSLVHDDLPSMDNDDYRRHRLTVHKAFNESIAILVGDALQTLSFKIVLQSIHLNRKQKVLILKKITNSGGSDGMVGGQSIDLKNTGISMTIEELEKMHQMKTGALIKACTMIGGISACLNLSQIRALERFGTNLGLVFQIVDDILDITANSKILGKTAGKDEINRKSTYVSTLGVKKAKILAKELHHASILAIKDIKHSDFLLRIADMVLNRSN